MAKKCDVIIIGAGISGLAAAYWIKKAGYSVQILEKSDRAGGSVQTDHQDGYLIEHGPNSGLETNPLIKKLSEELGILDQMIYANEEGNNRYIVRDGTLHSLPMAPTKFLSTKLFSTSAKFRVLKEFFTGKADTEKKETVAEFVSRRLGPEFLDYAINPFVAGVFAGDPTELSVRAAFPKLVALEDNYGGIFKGVIKGKRERKKRAKAGEESKQSAKMFSYQNGLSTLSDALADVFKDSLTLNTSVTEIAKSEDTWIVSHSAEGDSATIEADAVLFALPAYSAADLIKSIDTQASNTLGQIPYAKAVMIYSGYKKSSVPIDLDGFGYLVPEKEKLNILGTIWTSTIFPGRAPENYVAFTTFMGGRRQPEKIELDDTQLLAEMKSDFQSLMGIEADPEMTFIRRWPRAIPQYTLGHLEREEQMNQFESNNPGLFITGNHRGGISVADCIKNSLPRAESVILHLKEQALQPEN
ncbi:MAG: protoporphyrinogen oxidase [Candidatus Marinimicrobia bacterium]|nr:protoporphyrinogen oxidase [Candidatus Neomarinimicrobiota bacterium]